MQEPGRALIAANKSGVASKSGLIFGAQVVDYTYKGEIHINVINTSSKVVRIYEDMKLIQFLETPIFNSSIEISEDNNLASGTFDIVTEGSWSNPYTFADMYPGETPREVNFTLRNKGSLPMRVWMVIKNVSNNDNGISDSEQDWYDANGGVRNDIDSAMVYALNVDGSLALEQEAGITVNQIKDYYINLVKIDVGATPPSYGILESGESITVNQKFYLPPETENWAQSDIMNIEIEVLAQQADAQEPIKQLSFMQNRKKMNLRQTG